VPAHPVAMIELAHLAGRQRRPDLPAAEPDPGLRQVRDRSEHRARQVTDALRASLGGAGGRGDVGPGVALRAAVVQFVDLAGGLARPGEVDEGAGEIVDIEQRKALTARSGQPGGGFRELLDERQGGAVAGAVDHRRAQDHPGFARQPIDDLALAQALGQGVAGQARFARRERRDMDEARRAGLACRHGEAAGALDVGGGQRFGVAGDRAGAMDDGRGALRQPGERGVVEQIALDDLEVCRRFALEHRRPARQGAHRHAGLGTQGKDPAADEPGGSGECDGGLFDRIHPLQSVTPAKAGVPLRRSNLHRPRGCQPALA
jgi:hypothetical protein